MGLVSGIFQINGYTKDITTILNCMLKAQKHRDSGQVITYIDKNIALGMVNSQNDIFNENRTHSLEKENDTKGVYAFVDGVLLNTLELKRYFENSEYSFVSPSCSAVVAHAYKKWGVDFMKHLEGEFACVLWDDREKQLILARDPYGHKPLHYYSDNERFIFCSEIKGILTTGIRKEVDLISLSDFLSLNCIPYPGTIFKNILQVPPGCLVIIKNGIVKVQPFWKNEFHINQKISLDEAVVLITDTIGNAVKKRMVREDTYCFLSGGIDSSALVSFAAELSNKPINTVSVSFEEKERDESEFAAIMAKHVGANHHHVTAKPDSFFDMLDVLVFHHDAPFTDTSAYPTYYAAKLGRQFTNIILTGDGPDQTMGGSGHHVFAVKNNLFAKRNLLKRLICRTGSKIIEQLVPDPSPSLLARIQRSMYRDSLTPVSAAYDLRSFFPNIVKKFMVSPELWEIHSRNNPYLHPESWFSEAGEVDDVNKYLFADMKFYVPDDLMIKVDRMCMAHNLETLSPFQDVQLAKVVNTLPGKYKVNVSPNNTITTKFILKKVCERRFPKAVLTKKKQGFGIPLEKWLRQDNARFLREILLEPKTLNRGYFKKMSLEKFINDFINKKGDYFYPNSGGVVGLLTLELWHRRYID